MNNEDIQVSRAHWTKTHSITLIDMELMGTDPGELVGMGAVTPRCR